MLQHKQVVFLSVMDKQLKDIEANHQMARKALVVVQIGQVLVVDGMEGFLAIMEMEAQQVDLVLHLQMIQM